MASPLTLQVATRGHVVVATFAGELDGAETEGVRGRLLAALASEAHGLVCDLSSLSYIDSAGVHLLGRLARALRADDQRIALVLPTRPTPRQVLEITGITQAIPHSGTVDEAAARISSR